MNTRKFFCTLFFLLVFATGAFAARKPAEVRGGMLSYLGTTEEAFQQGVDELNSLMRLSSMGVGFSRNYASDVLEMLKVFQENRYVVTFFDSLTAMLMALDAGKIDDISLPEITARYVMKNDSEYKILFALRIPSAIAFGFRNESTALRDEFNTAITAMKADGTLKELEEKYIGNGTDFQADSAAFAKFDGADTIKVAVTGDMPPVDYINEKGTAAGYNTAVISEIGKRLKKNVEIINIEAGARSASLTSGRADVIFWYRTTEGVEFPEEIAVNDNPVNKVINDTTEGVILSEPYYRWERVLFLTK